MPHIDLKNDAPGMRSLLHYRPETGRLICELAEVLLRAPGSLTPGERELIASYVSDLNECEYCTNIHSAFAAAQVSGGMPVVRAVRADPGNAPISDKLRALLEIAAAVQRGGRRVRAEHVTAAREAGATDLEIHDTVLIAAMFCMANRYVDGLATLTPDDPAMYEAAAESLVEHGYLAILDRAGEPSAASQ